VIKKIESGIVAVYHRDYRYWRSFINQSVFHVWFGWNLSPTYIDCWTRIWFSSGQPTNSVKNDVTNWHHNFRMFSFALVLLLLLLLQRKVMLLIMMQGTTRHWNSDSPVDWLLNFAHGHTPGKHMSISF